MSVKSTLAKLIFIVAVIGIMVFAAVTPGVVRAFFVENNAADIAGIVFHRQPVQVVAQAQPARVIQGQSAPQAAQGAVQAPAQDASAQPASAVVIQGASADDMYHHVMTGTVVVTGTLDSINGNTWMVSGVTVVLTTTTEIEGTPTIGAKVKVEGTKLADGSVLAREIKIMEKEHVNLGTKVEFTGTVTAMNGNMWTVDATTVIITATTEVHGTFAVGDKVKVEGYKQTDGTVLAKEISPFQPKKHHQKEVEFSGTIKSMNGSTWMVDDVTVIISSTTEVKGTFVVGDKVKVEGYKQDDGSVLAKEIKPAEKKEEHENNGKGIEFVGTLTAMNGNVWTVDAFTVTIDGKTQFEGSPKVGDKIRVAGQKQSDGTIVANNIKVVNGRDGEDNGKGNGGENNGKGNGGDGNKGGGSGGGEDHGKGGSGGGSGSGGNDHKGGGSGGGDDNKKGGGDHGGGHKSGGHD